MINKIPARTASEIKARDCEDLTKTSGDEPRQQPEKKAKADRRVARICKHESRKNSTRVDRA